MKSALLLLILPLISIKSLGPGLLESVYEIILSDEIIKRGLKIKRQEAIAVSYKGTTFQEGFRADIIIEDLVILELKTVSAIQPVHKKQLLTYLKLTKLKLGYILNFNEELMKHGIVRMLNGYLN